MVVIFHDGIDKDLTDAVIYYSNEASRELAVEFYAEFERCVDIIGQRARSFSFYFGKLRRLNFHRFPYHILFEVLSDDTVQLVTVKHDRRHPAYGTDRT
jgi:plasmid stabilization system protein ParE